MSREYFIQSGKPEKKHIRERFEQIANREHSVSFHVESEYDEETFKKEWVERVKEALERVDFGLLKKLIDDITERCGVLDEQPNFIDSNKISLKERKNGGEDDKYVNGTYHIFSNSIAIFPHNLIYSLYLGIVLPLLDRMDSSPTKSVVVPAEKLILSDEMVEFAVLRILIHEQVHAISFTKIVSEHTQGFWKRLAKTVKGKGLMSLSSVLSGYQKNLFTRDQSGEYQSNRDFLAFDEGVTDKLAFEILSEYLSVTGSEITVEQQTKFFQEDLQKTTYGLCVQLVDEVVGKIAQNAGMDERTVWQALVRSKIEGVNLEDTEIAQFIDESTFEGFFDKLKKLQPNDIHDAEELKTCLNQ